MVLRREPAMPLIRIDGILYMRLTNWETGKVADIPQDPKSKAEYRFSRSVRGVQRYQDKYDLDAYALTHTLNGRFRTVAAVDKVWRRNCDWISRRFARRRKPMKYIWVPGIQAERLAKTGDEVNSRNYHTIIVCERGALPNQVKITLPDGSEMWRTVEDGTVISIQDLREYWGPYGFLNCGLALIDEAVWNYLGKNYREAAEYHIPAAKRFGCSQLGHFAYPQWAFEFIENALLDRPWLTDYKVKRSNGKVFLFSRDPDGHLVEVASARSPWVDSQDDSRSDSRDDPRRQLAEQDRRIAVGKWRARAPRGSRRRLALDPLDRLVRGDAVLSAVSGEAVAIARAAHATGIAPTCMFSPPAASEAAAAPAALPVAEWPAPSEAAAPAASSAAELPAVAKRSDVLPAPTCRFTRPAPVSGETAAAPAALAVGAREWPAAADDRPGELSAPACRLLPADSEAAVAPADQPPAAGSVAAGDQPASAARHIGFPPRPCRGADHCIARAGIALSRLSGDITVHPASITDSPPAHEGVETDFSCGDEVQQTDTEGTMTNLGDADSLTLAFRYR